MDRTDLREAAQLSQEAIEIVRALEVIDSPGVTISAATFTPDLRFSDDRVLLNVTLRL